MKIGFLPLYIELYDKIGYAARTRLEKFYETLACAFEKCGVDVIRTPFCRLASEFSEAVAVYEREGADCIVTWHAAYSPSLESIDALTATSLPIVVMDTTETFDFSPLQDSGEISCCHGIHGVMDMCSMLRQRGKTFAIAAGHYPQSDVLERVIGYVKAAVAARALSGSKVGILGTSFPGMGDFGISDEELEAGCGVKVVYGNGTEIAELKAAVSEDAVSAEVKEDLNGAVKLNEFTEETHRLTVRNCLAVRKWLEKNGLDAFSVCFLDITPELGLDIMPFMETCKAMARGIGYAGEGDILTAALVGALMKGFDTATFIEIFCPDWKNNTLLLSHMGEANYALVEDKPALKELNFIFGEASNPIVGYARYREGKATFVNLFKGADGYKLLVSPVQIQGSDGEDRFVSSIRGWMRPAMPISDFLEKISEAGVTHHSALVYEATPEQLAFFGRLLGLEVISI